MSMKARYSVVNGEVIAEKRSGVRKLYVPDPLGSTVALLDNTQTPTDTFSYWPYGEIASRTGTTSTPFQFDGTEGYYRDSSGRDYVRARVLDKQKGRWLTQDPIGFDGGDWNIYRYVENGPVSMVDPSGLQLTLGQRTLEGSKYHRPPAPENCPSGTKACWVTCYNGNDSPYWDRNKSPCKGEISRPGICSSYCSKYGKDPSFPIGCNVHFHGPPDKHLPHKGSCRMCECGSYTDPKKHKPGTPWPPRPSCWIDVWTPSGKCEPYWYCVS